MSYKSYNNYLGSNRCCNTTGPGSKGAQGAQGAGGPIGPIGGSGLQVIGPFDTIGATASILLSYPSEPGTTGIYYTDAIKLYNSGTNTDIIFSGNLIPDLSNTYTLGSEDFTWKDVKIGPGSVSFVYENGPIATISANVASIIYTETGFATPFINVGPAISSGATFGVAAGWQIGSTGDFGTPSFDLIAQQIGPSGLVGTIYSLINNSGSTGITGPQGATGPAGIKGDTGSQGVTGPVGIKGDTGSQGSTGVQGVTGPVGIKGDTGSQGSTGVQGATGSQGDTGSQGSTGAQGATGSRRPTGNTIEVDSVYGDNVLAALNPYSYPFKTITAGLTAAGYTVGQLVVVNAGTYNESIIVPPNTSLEGTGTQAVIIQQLGVTGATTLIQVNSNCRVENFTANLSSAANVNLTGIDFLQGSPTTSKLRNSVFTVTGWTGATGANVYGVRSGGTGPIPSAYTSANAIQRSTINVVSSGGGLTRGIYIDGANRFSVRDMVVYVSGNTGATGMNIIGIETAVAGAYAEVKTSTINGTLTVKGTTGTFVNGIAYDIKGYTGAVPNIVLGATDLYNKTADGNSLIPAQAPATFQFGVIGDIKNATYNLVPGTCKEADLASLTFPIPIINSALIISIVLSCNHAPTIAQSLTFNLYDLSSPTGSLVTPVLSLILPAGAYTSYLINKSYTYLSGRFLCATLVATTNPGFGANGSFSATVSYY